MEFPPAANGSQVEALFPTGADVKSDELSGCAEANLVQT